MKVIGPSLFALTVWIAAPAYADRIVIPVVQTQTAANNGSQGQFAGGGTGDTSQVQVLDQSIQQSQAVNIYVPDNYRGVVKSTQVNIPDKSLAKSSQFRFDGSARGNSFLNRRDGRGVQNNPGKN